MDSTNIKLECILVCLVNPKQYVVFHLFGFTFLILKRFGDYAKVEHTRKSHDFVQYIDV